MSKKTKTVPDEFGRQWTKEFLPGGEFSTFIVRDPDGKEAEHRTCGEFEAERLFNEWTPKQVSALDFEDGA